MKIDKASPLAAASTMPTATPIAYGVPPANTQIFAAFMVRRLKRVSLVQDRLSNTEAKDLPATRTGMARTT